MFRGGVLRWRTIAAMRLDGLIRFLFIQYCIAAGVLLIVAPWSQLWERMLVLLPYGVLPQVVGHSAARGAVSGFGLVHLTWAFHDLGGLLLQKKPPGDDEGSS